MKLTIVMSWILTCFMILLKLPIAYLTLDGCTVDVVFAVDTSESMVDLGPYGQPLLAWQKHQSFIKKIVQHLPIGQSSHHSRAAMLTYSSTPNHVFHLSQHSTVINVQDAISRASILGGNTNSAAAFRAVREVSLSSNLGARNNARKVVVLFTDGLSNLDTHLTSYEAQLLKYSASEVFSVAISEEHNIELLRNVSSQPHDKHIVIARDLDDLDDLLALTLAHRICQIPDPVITERPSTCLPKCKTCSNEEVCEQCYEGFYPKEGKCEACMEQCAVCTSYTSCDVCMIGWYWEPLTNQCQECEVVADLAFVIDSSGSIRDKNPKDKTYDNYQLLKNFVNHIIDRLDVQPDRTRVGAVRFSSSSELVFTLDRFSDKHGMKHVINTMKYDGHETNIADAIKMMRQEIFVQDRGDRPDIQNIGLIITDGESNVHEGRTLSEAYAARQEGIVLFVVGVTDMINVNELKAIATDPDSDHFFNSTEIRYLDNIMQNLIKHVCTPLNEGTG